MKIHIVTLATVLLSLASFCSISAQTTDLPREWVDPDTNHRIVRLSDEAGSQSFYFHQNGYTASGDKFVFRYAEWVIDIQLQNEKDRADRRWPNRRRDRRR